jgi:hypothetical protein
MKSIVQFEEENRIEMEALFDRVISCHESILNKLDYRNLVIFLYKLYSTRGY